MLTSSASPRAAGRRAKVLAFLTSTFVGAVVLAASGAAFAQCTGPGAPAKGSPVVCMTAITIPGNTLTSFDISWFNPTRQEYYLGDRSNAGIDIISTAGGTPKFVKTIGGFVGVVIGNATLNTANNAKSGPDGVTAHGNWLYAGDGNSTLKVIDLIGGTITQSIPTGGTTRLDEMALTSDGKMLLAANNAEDPPFATMFAANGDNAAPGNVTIVSKILVDSSLMPTGEGLSIEQPVWDQSTQRFYVSVPQINYPAGCTPGAASPPPTGVVPCQGGLLVIDPKGVSPGTTVYGAYNATANAGMMALSNCGPNGATVGPPQDGLTNNLLLGCTPANMPSNTGTVAINTATRNYTTIANIVGSDEVWYNPGDNRYFTGSSANPFAVGGGCTVPGTTARPAACPVLGIISAASNLLIGTIPQGTGSHSVAADNIHNLIFVPQIAPKNVAGAPAQGAGDTSGNSANICGGFTGCVAVYMDESPNID